MTGEIDLTRLGRGEVMAGASGLLLLICMVFPDWYGASSHLPPITYTGWEALSILRWLMVLAVVAAFGLVFLQVTRRAPALPVTASVIVTTLGATTVLALVYRVISPPGELALDPKVGAFLGLLGAIGIAYGGYLSLRREGMPDRDARTDIETIVADRTPVDR